MELERKRWRNWFVSLDRSNDLACKLENLHLRQAMSYRSAAFCLHGLVELDDTSEGSRKPSRRSAEGKKKAIFAVVRQQPRIAL